MRSALAASQPRARARISAPSMIRASHASDQWMVVLAREMKISAGRVQWVTNLANTPPCSSLRKPFCRRKAAKQMSASRTTTDVISVAMLGMRKLLVTALNTVPSKPGQLGLRF